MKLKTCFVALLCLGTVNAFAEPGSAGSAPGAPAAVEAGMHEVVLDWENHSRHVSRSLTVRQDVAASKLQLTHLALADLSPVQEVEVRTGADFQTRLPHAKPVEEPREPAAWYFVVDVSGTSAARERAIAAELKTVLDVMRGLPKADSVYLYALSTDIEKWGEARAAGERGALETLIQERVARKQFGDEASFRRSSLIYVGLSKLIALPAEGASRRVVVLLSDGKDETGGNVAASANERENAKKRVVDGARAAHVVIHTLGFEAQGGDRGGFTHLFHLAEGTEGLYLPAALGSFAFAEGENPAERLPQHPSSRAHRYALELPLPPALEHDIRVVLKGGRSEGQVTILRSKLQLPEVEPPAPPPPPPPPPPPLPAEPVAAEPTAEQQALSSLLDKLDPLASQLAELTQRLNAEPACSKAEYDAMVEAIRAGAATCAEQLNALRGMDVAALRTAVEELCSAEGTPEDRRARAQGILALCEGASAVSWENVPGLLGCGSFPPPAPPEPSWLTRWWLPISAGAGALCLLLLVGISLFLLKRRQRRRLLVSAQGAEKEPAKGVDCVRPVLCELENVHEHQVWKIRKPTATIGRDVSSDVSISNTSVSASHCILKQDRAGNWTLTDMGSVNGIYFQEREQTYIELYDGCEFELGEVRLRFHDCSREDDSPVKQIQL